MGDLWELDLNSPSWKQVSGAMNKGPAARYDAAFTGAVSGLYVLHRTSSSWVLILESVLYGGRAGSTIFGDSWLFNASSGSWVPQCDAASCDPNPSARYVRSTSHSAIWMLTPLLQGVASTQSAGDDSVLIYGGVDAQGAQVCLCTVCAPFDATQNDTWHLYVDVEGSWSAMHTATPPPPSRVFGSFLSINVNLNILFGGLEGKTKVADVWSYSPFCMPAAGTRLGPSNGGGWSKMSNTGKTLPSPRTSAVMASQDDGSLLVVGGVDQSGKVLSDVWSVQFA